MEVQGHPWLHEKAEALSRVPSSESTQQNEQRPMLGSPAELSGPFSPFSKPGKDPVCLLPGFPQDPPVKGT